MARNTNKSQKVASALFQKTTPPLFDLPNNPTSQPSSKPTPTAKPAVKATPSNFVPLKMPTQAPQPTPSLSQRLQNVSTTAVSDVKKVEAGVAKTTKKGVQNAEILFGKKAMTPSGKAIPSNVAGIDKVENFKQTPLEKKIGDILKKVTVYGYPDSGDELLTNIITKLFPPRGHNSSGSDSKSHSKKVNYKPAAKTMVTQRTTPKKLSVAKSVGRTASRGVRPQIG